MAEDNSLEFLKQTFLNKEVQIYPNDTECKWGIVRDITSHGVVFEVTKGRAAGWPIGAMRFVSWNANLTFKLDKENLCSN